MSNNTEPMGFEFEEFSAETPRFVVIDWLKERKREKEAELLMQSRYEVKLSKKNEIICAVIEAHLADPAPGLPIELNVSVARPSRGRALPQIGERIRVRGSMYQLVRVSPATYVTSDWIEDNDAWSDYPEGPGSYVDAVYYPVHETEQEKAKREASEDAETAEKRKAKEEKDLFDAIVASFSGSETHEGFRHATRSNGSSFAKIFMTRSMVTAIDGTPVRSMGCRCFDTLPHSMTTGEILFTFHLRRRNASNRSSLNTISSNRSSKKNRKLSKRRQKRSWLPTAKSQRWTAEDRPLSF
ncbi:MAG: hypothetical protein HC888_00675 [Candidatus Competibacteraceae bacterium]|nr:hypothetical protein [Candidatus Competibacteraceae bacterium]